MRQIYYAQYYVPEFRKSRCGSKLAILQYMEQDVVSWSHIKPSISTCAVSKEKNQISHKSRKVDPIHVGVQAEATGICNWSFSGSHRNYQNKSSNEDWDYDIFTCDNAQKDANLCWVSCQTTQVLLPMSYIEFIDSSISTNPMLQLTLSCGLIMNSQNTMQFVTQLDNINLVWEFFFWQTLRDLILVRYGIELLL